MISVTDTMIVQVYKRPQNACLVALACLQHPPCSPDVINKEGRVYVSATGSLTLFSLVPGRVRVCCTP